MKLNKPLVILDLETTGVWIEKDKIIEIAMIRCLQDGTQTSFVKYVNPGIPIPPIVSTVTGIKDEHVKDSPKFRELAGEIFSFIGDADIGGFNVERFDLPLLQREFSECGIRFEFHQRNIYDAQKVYHLHERRDLTAAYRFYCGQELKSAHSALADTQASLDVLRAQVVLYGQGQESIETLREFNYRKKSEFYDSERKLRWWNGELYLMFGKYARKTNLRDLAKNDRSYLEWILTQDFNPDVRDVVEKVLAGQHPAPPGDADILPE